MTAADTISHIILDKGGDNQVTIYTTRVEEMLSKKLLNITPPQSTANRAAGPKDTKIVDLLRVEERFSIKAQYDSTNKSKLKGMFKQGGVIKMEWESEDYWVNFDKMTLFKDERENSEREMEFTCIVGVDL